MSNIMDNGDVAAPRFHRRSAAGLVASLECLAENSQHLLTKPLGQFEVGAETYTLPRYLFRGPKGGGDVIRLGLFAGVLSAPPKMRPRPFEIVLEAPQAAPQFLQERALVTALLAILAEYRVFMAYAPHL